MKKIILVASAIFLTGVASPAPSGRFSAEFYKSLASSQQDRNFAFSPYSISQAFESADLGARGETRKEIEESIDLNMRTESSGELNVANRIWLQRGANIEKSYLAEMKTKLNAEPGLVDFTRRPEVAAGTINHWVEEQTHKKIKNLIPPNTLSEQSRIVLTNAVYFKASWEHPFNPGDTFDDDFVLSSGRKARIPFMHEHKHLYYTDDGRARILQLPYAGYRFAMLIVLPKEEKTLEEIEKGLGPSVLSGWTQGLKSADVRLAMPRFKFDSSFVLNDVLKSLGVRRAFEAGTADFSGIDGARDLFISQVFHKAYLKVDEAGTEAAAATAVAVTGMALQEPAKPIEFKADHPFIFLIQDLKTKTILFMGRLTNPRS